MPIDKIFFFLFVIVILKEFLIPFFNQNSLQLQSCFEHFFDFLSIKRLVICHLNKVFLNIQLIENWFYCFLFLIQDVELNSFVSHSQKQENVYSISIKLNQHTSVDFRKISTFLSSTIYEKCLFFIYDFLLFTIKIIFRFVWPTTLGEKHIKNAKEARKKCDVKNIQEKFITAAKKISLKKHVSSINR